MKTLVWNAVFDNGRCACGVSTARWSMLGPVTGLESIHSHRAYIMPGGQYRV